MEDHCSPLSWAYYSQEEHLEGLKHSLLYTTLELETTILSAQEEISKRECELNYVKDLLNKTIKERDEAKTRCQKLEMDNNLLLQKQLISVPTSEGESEKGSDFKRAFSSPCEVGLEDPTITQQKLLSSLPQEIIELAAKKPLPEKGKLLKAVAEAGPLLQTLLLAGPLPQWQHPPPQLDSIEIPPVTVSVTSSSRSHLQFQDSDSAS